jgi:hypothetical protein
MDVDARGMSRRNGQDSVAAAMLKSRPGLHKKKFGL